MCLERSVRLSLDCKHKQRSLNAQLVRCKGKREEGLEAGFGQEKEMQATRAELLMHARSLLQTCRHICTPALVYIAANVSQSWISMTITDKSIK
jgi:hypothetical protein